MLILVDKPIETNEQSTTQDTELTITLSMSHGVLAARVLAARVRPARCGYETSHTYAR